MAATYHVLTSPLQFKKIGGIPRKFPHRVCPDFPARFSLLFRICGLLFREDAEHGASLPSHQEENQT
jgi:hypothetical protein